MIASFQSLMQRLQIKAVYWIDDENAAPAELDAEKLVGTLAEQLSVVDASVQKKTLNKLRQSVEGRRLADAIQKKLSAEDIDDVVGTVLDLLLKDLANAVPDVVASVTEMLDVLPHPLGPEEKAALMSTFSTQQGWTWSPLSFKGWQTSHATILEKHFKTDQKALLVVDLQNSREKTPVSGKDVLSQWAVSAKGAQNSESVYVVALTSQFKQENELIEGRRFTKDLFGGTATPNIPVFVLSKERLALQDPADTAADRTAAAIEDVLGRMRACNVHSSLSSTLGGIFARSAQSAFAVLQQLSIEELLYAVSTSSFAEGTSEVDTLVRMASVAQREALLREIAQSPKVREQVIELRGLQDHVAPLTAGDLDSTDGIERLRCSELHDPSDVVNALFSPIATGDIFEVGNDSRKSYHVLVANACDLMLRGKTGGRVLDIGMLLTLTDGNTEKNDPDSLIFPINHFPPGSTLSGRTMTADLRRLMSVPLSVLDLCWTDPAGLCTWERNRKLPDELALLPSQIRRYNLIHAELSSLNGLGALNAFAPWVSAETRLSSDHRQIIGIKFNLRRIGRLSTRMAAVLVHRYAQTLARPSLEHDFLPTKAKG